MKSPIKLQGTYTALVTPFKNGVVDYEGFRKNIHFQLKEGINGLLVLGTTGETPTLTPQEKEELICITLKEVNGRVPVMVGAGSNSTEHTIAESKKAKEFGADMVLIVTPYYNKPTQEGIFRHFKAVTDNVDIPIVVYNIQGRTGMNIETATLKRIAELPTIIGVKEASGNVDQMGAVYQSIVAQQQITPQQNKHLQNFTLMSGDDALTLPCMSLGGQGVISVVSNLVPRPVVALVNAALEGDFAKAREIHYELLPLFKGAFIETNPIPIKAAMNMVGLAAGDYRLPMCEMQPENKEKLRKVLVEMKLL